MATQQGPDLDRVQRLALELGEVIKQVADYSYRLGERISEALAEYDVQLRDILEEHKFLVASSWAASDVDATLYEHITADTIERLKQQLASAPVTELHPHARTSANDVPDSDSDDRFSHRFPERPLSHDVARNAEPGAVSVTHVEGRLQTP